MGAPGEKAANEHVKTFRDQGSENENILASFHAFSADAAASFTTFSSLGHWQIGV